MSTTCIPLCVDSSASWTSSVHGPRVAWTSNLSALRVAWTQAYTTDEGHGRGELEFPPDHQCTSQYPPPVHPGPKAFVRVTLNVIVIDSSRKKARSGAYNNVAFPNPIPAVSMTSFPSRILLVSVICQSCSCRYLSFSVSMDKVQSMSVSRLQASMLGKKTQGL